MQVMAIYFDLNLVTVQVSEEVYPFYPPLSGSKWKGE